MLQNHWDNDFPKPPHSYWMASTNVGEYPALTGDVKVDTVVVGGGLVGITTAWLLKKEGLSVALLEADRLLQGTTGHTTAKVTLQHDLIYKKIQTGLGREIAAQYALANQTALDWISKITADKHIDCDFVRQPAYVYTQREDYIRKIEDEATTAQSLGIASAYLEETPLPYPVKAALRFDDQAQFHPLKYLKVLAEEIPGGGSHIFEQTRALDIHTGRNLTVTTEKGSIEAEKVVIATHFPFYDGYGLYFSRLYPDRSYALGITIKENYPGGMYITAEDPGRSLRSQKLPEGELIIVGGEHHKTGQGEDTRVHYRQLVEFAQKNFTVTDIGYRWSTQDYTTADEVPYAGRLTDSTPNIYTATGFRKWGMTNGTASSLLLRDLIVKGQSPWQDLYNPSRFTIKASATNFVVENADVAKHLVMGKLRSLPKDVDLAPGEGMLVKGEGQQLGVYRDEMDALHWVDTTCTHMGCELSWNAAEKSWDCPCHGSRFTYEGEIIEGPALKPLNKHPSQP